MDNAQMQRELTTAFTHARRRRLQAQHEVIVTQRALHHLAEMGDYEAAELAAASLLREVGALRRRLQLEAIASEAIDGAAAQDGH